ncbi:MAG: hypothetical protein LBP19_05440 [Treponema sp.]|jgi:hypothetical protein|nr:hypothetical protein [Treponema sp.]
MNIKSTALIFSCASPAETAQRALEEKDISPRPYFSPYADYLSAPDYPAADRWVQARPALSAVPESVTAGVPFPPPPFLFTPCASLFVPQVIIFITHDMDFLTQVILFLTQVILFLT